MCSFRLHSIALGALLVGCGGTSDPPATVEGRTLSIETGAYEIPAGDTTMCFYTNARTTEEFNVPYATGSQGTWGHHLLLYYTDIEREPGYHPCTESEMVSWRQIVGVNLENYSAGEFQDGMPEGGAVKVPPGKQIVVQSHNINTTGSPQMTEDRIVIKLLDTTEVRHFINSWILFDEQFEVPPNSATKHVSECTVESDLQVLTFTGHMHEWGKHFKLERLDESGAPVETLYETDWALHYDSHPPLTKYTLDAPYALPAGTRVRQTCEWSNTTPNPLTFPQEMCVGFAYYFPDAGALDCATEYPPQP
jgi:hypothetical protein